MGMAYWLLKTEPQTYSFDQLLKDKETRWDDVRNYQARNFLRQLKIGDQAFIYHSGDDKCIVGIAQVSSAPFAEPTQDPGDWTTAHIIPLKKLKRVLPLSELKSTQALKDLMLIKQSRLSVMPITQDQAKTIMELASQ